MGADTTRYPNFSPTRSNRHKSRRQAATREIGSRREQKATRESQGEPAAANESGPGTAQGQEQEQKQERAQEQVDADAITFSDPASGAYKPRAHVHSVTHSHTHTIIQPHDRRASVTHLQGRNHPNHTIAGTQDARTRGCRGMIGPTSANKNRPTDKGAQQRINYVIAVSPQQPHIRLLPIVHKSTESLSDEIRTRLSDEHAHSTARIRTAQKHRLLIAFNKLFQNL